MLSSIIVFSCMYACWLVTNHLNSRSTRRQPEVDVENYLVFCCACLSCMLDFCKLVYCSSRAKTLMGGVVVA